MIGRLTGLVLEKQAPQLLLDVAGIGYELLASMNTFYSIPELNNTVTLHTHLVVREDAHTLYGFASKDERGLFRELIKVNGIGPKVALSILSSIEVSMFIHCVANGDSARLVKIPGIGKKTAERLLIEMRDRLKDWESSSPLNNVDLSTANHSNQHSLQEEAANALQALGYKSQEALRAIAKVAEEGLTSEQMIRLALQGMAK